jgi:hypothetical protein
MPEGVTPSRGWTWSDMATLPSKTSPTAQRMKAGTPAAPVDYSFMSLASLSGTLCWTFTSSVTPSGAYLYA